MYSTPSKSQPFSGHGFTICFTACKPRKKSVIPTSRVLHRHFWWKHKDNRFKFINESCNTSNSLFLLKFKMTIFTNIWSIFSWQNRTCKYWIEKGWSIFAMDCIADKPSGCKSKTYCVATYLKCQSLCQISVSRGDWWAVQKPMCIETWNCWLLCLTYNKE